MKNSPWFALSAALLTGTSLLGAPAMADSIKHISYTVDASALESVEFEISVAEIEIEVYNGEEIQLDIELKSQRNWFSWRRPDIEDIELEVRGNGGHVFLGIDETNIEQYWRVRLPAKLVVEMDLGVGDIRIQEFSNSLEMEVGVGAVRVEVNDTEYGEIHLSAGVGDASISGFDNRSDNERSFISAESFYHGSGDLKIDIEVGVGDIEVRNM